MATDTYTFPTNQSYEQYYQSIMASMPQQEVAYSPIKVAEQTQSSIAESVSAALRPYYDASIRDRQATTRANQAELAADAYSRGMGSSTWLSDMNARQVSAQASDIADIEGQYAANLYSSVNTQYQNYLANKLSADATNASNQLATDEYNSQLKRAVQEMAWARFIDQYNMGLYSSGSGSGGNPNGDGLFTDNVDYQSAIATLKALGVDTKTGVDYLLAGTVPSSSDATTKTPDNGWIERTLNG